MTTPSASSKEDCIKRAIQHREEALRCGRGGWENLDNAAIVHALLAIEARLEQMYWEMPSPESLL